MQLDTLVEFVRKARRLAVLTGAGCSTASGIPAYRDSDGRWQHSAPVLFQDFIADAAVRRRYWARSLIGWRHMHRAAPNPGHTALADLESMGLVDVLLTQNVDGLHRRAGSGRVIELHGRLSDVLCLACGARFGRGSIQRQLRALNPGRAALGAAPAPDGDAGLDGRFDDFCVPDCPGCGGVLKPDVVFFGECVPKPRVALAFERLRAAGALLVVGSSLMVQSGYRFVREASRIGIPVAAINIGRTRADELFTLKVAAACDRALPALLERLSGPSRQDVGAADSRSYFVTSADATAARNEPPPRTTSGPVSR